MIIIEHFHIPTLVHNYSKFRITNIFIFYYIKLSKLETIWQMGFIDPSAFRLTSMASNNEFRPFLCASFENCKSKCKSYYSLLISISCVSNYIYLVMPTADCRFNGNELRFDYLLLLWTKYSPHFFHYSGHWQIWLQSVKSEERSRKIGTFEKNLIYKMCFFLLWCVVCAIEKSVNKLLWHLSLIPIDVINKNDIKESFSSIWVFCFFRLFYGMLLLAHVHFWAYNFPKYLPKAVVRSILVEIVVYSVCIKDLGRVYCKYCAVTVKLANWSYIVYQFLHQIFECVKFRILFVCLAFGAFGAFFGFDLDRLFF